MIIPLVVIVVGLIAFHVALAWECRMLRRELDAAERRERIG